MNVLHVNCNYIGSKLHRVMMEHFKKSDFAHKVFVPTYLDVYEDLGNNVKVAKCFKKWDRVLFYYKQRKIIRALEKNINVATFDIIHAYTLFTDGNVAYEMHKKYGIPYVVAIRNTDVNAFFKYMLHLRSRGIKIMQSASAVFFLSEAYKNKVFSKYVPDEIKESLEKKTYIVPNGIDDFWHEHKQNAHALHNPVRIIYAGRIDKNKNITTTQKALEILRSRGIDTKFTVVGPVIDKSVYKDIEKDAHTSCLPARPKEELVNIYRENDVFVMPSFAETFGLVYVEAMSQGLPVIYTQGEGFDGQFPEGEVGYSVDPHSPEKVADTIEKLINNYAALTATIVDKVDRYKWEKITDEYEYFYIRSKFI